MIAQPLSVQSLTSGQSNQTLRLVSATEDYVLKRWRHERLFAVDRELEVAIQKQLAQQSFAPKVLDYDLEQGWLLQPYYRAQSLEQASLSSMDKASVLAETLSRAHSLSLDIPHWSLAERVEHYLQQLRLLNGALAAQMRQELLPMKSLLKDWLQYPVLCHNDLSMNHILMADPIRVIDWEYAGLGHPLFDIASTIKINQLSHDMTARLISDYEKKTRYQIDRRRLAQWCEFVDWLNKVWQHLLQQAS